VTRRLPVLALALAAGSVVLSACGGSGSSEPAAGPGTSTAAGATSGEAPSSASRGSAQGLRLTRDGSSLHFGDTATVSWAPDQKTTGAIAVKVTKVEKVPISAFRAWRLTGTVRRSTPYYVHAAVRNVGASDLSGVPAPLYLLDRRNVLLQASTFRARFAPCPSTPFPSRFTHGRRTSVCLVYFVPQHGTMEAVSFRPTQTVDGITWHGPVTRARR
jgi:hypothetical protein